MGVHLLPTDTVPGLASSTQTDDVVHLKRAFQSLIAAGPGLDALPFTWHAHSAKQVADAIGATTPILRRAMSRLWPGPVTLTIEVGQDTLIPLRATLGTALADDGRAVWVRIPDHPAALEFIQTRGPILARGIPDGQGGLCPTLASARQRLAGAGISFHEIASDGPPGSGLPSTLVRLPLSGGFRVERVGALSAESVRQRMTLRVLFVCTGNTCRSPMAERIARHLVERRPAGSIPIDVASAGTTAMPGEPTTPEALEALRRRGIEARGAGAKPLDTGAIRWADQVFTMTTGHLRQAHALGAKEARLLDPAGRDVPDPIGGTQRQYDETARRLAELIEARLQELSV